MFYVILITILIIIVILYLVLRRFKKHKKHDKQESFLTKTENTSSSSSDSSDSSESACPPMTKVNFTVVAVDNNALKINISPVDNAESYDINIRATTNNTNINTTDTTVLSQTIPVPLGTYVVTVIARNRNCRSSPSASTPITVNGPACNVDNDCISGTICSMGHCIPGCNTNHSCPLGQSCTNGICILGCQSQTDCPDNTFCRLGQCISGCLSDVNCPLGTICDVQNQTCIPGCNGVCPPGLHCNGTVCVPGCIKDENCPTGQHCDTFNNTCVQCVRNGDCPSSTPICNSLTHTCTGCLSDLDCPLGNICNNGTCSAGCRTNVNCPSNTPFCNNGTCTACRTNNDCFPGDICDTNNGECVGCLVDTDCPVGTFCSGNNCVTGCRVDSNCPLETFCSNGICTPGCHVNTNCPLPIQTCNTMTKTCVECFSNTDCPQGQTCTNNICSCHIFSVAGITLSNNNIWPQTSDWVFNIPGSTPGQTLISFRWEITGNSISEENSSSDSSSSDSSEEATISGFLPPTALTNNTFNASQIEEIWQCNDSDLYGCPSQCQPNSTVNILITDLTITNSCGQISEPTCWQLTNLCSGNKTFTQIPC